ncbi:Papain family cysteine protease [Candidatus Anstonella stagnisolia]|nr:Papain family cysteine protease [Candidatus Anstonella stagnisolia]
MGDFPPLSFASIASAGSRIRFGWLPDPPDSRDYTKGSPKVAPLLRIPSIVPSLVDLRAFCPPIFDQGELGSCTANAASALLQYHRMRTLGKTGPLSRLFIYKGTRDLMQAAGDTGAYIRTTMGALALFGAPPEKYWEYDAKMLDIAPPAFCYSYAQNYQALSYFRLDEKSESAGTNPAEKSKNAPVKPESIAEKSKTAATNDKRTVTKEPALILSNIKETLSSGLPAMFGFTVYESMNGASNGKIPFPSENERVLGGHAVLCVGYDDKMEIGSQRGAFLIRNSWGEGWGEKGYGWLPYEYLLQGIAQDWWVLVKAEWVETEQFGV